MRSRFPLVIAGPTGSGKTAVAAELARLVNGEIISADSRQVYKYRDVGTNKAGAWDASRGLRVFEGVPQHLTDLIEPSRSFSAGDFVRLCREAMQRMEQEGKTPVITGGTGLYLKALIDGLAPVPERSEPVRRALSEKLQRLGKEYLYTELKAVDPASAEKNRGNPQRLIRALEVYELTGMPLSHWHAKTEAPSGRFLQFGLLWDREELYRTIYRRSAAMLSGGMIEETKRVLAMGYPKDCPGLKSLGYRYVVEYLEGKLGIDAVRKLLRHDTRRYAKRQMTWFRKDARIEWLSVKDADFDPRETAKQIFKKLSNLI
ncbi:MAG: tRNA (adenosine(37)-N6)-dimethylallyltransferase MiaA [Endomicrobiales bacterium]